MEGKGEKEESPCRLTVGIGIFHGIHHRTRAGVRVGASAAGDRQKRLNAPAGEGLSQVCSTGFPDC